MDVVRATDEQIMDAVRDTEDALLRPKSPGARSLGEDSERRSTTVRMEGHSSQMPQTSTVSSLDNLSISRPAFSGDVLQPTFKDNLWLGSHFSLSFLLLFTAIHSVLGSSTFRTSFHIYRSSHALTMMG